MDARIRRAEFNKLWIGYSISTIGSQVTVLALPLAAVLLFGAGATETGVLVAARMAPIVLAEPFVGVWVDRHPRRLLLISAAIGSALAVGSVPGAAFLGVLTLGSSSRSRSSRGPSPRCRRPRAVPFCRRSSAARAS